MQYDSDKPKTIFTKYKTCSYIIDNLHVAALLVYLISGNLS